MAKDPKFQWISIFVALFALALLWSCNKEPSEERFSDAEITRGMQHWATALGHTPLHWRLRLYTSPDKYFADIGEAELITEFPGDDSHEDWHVRFVNGEELLLRCFMGSDENVHLATSVALYPSSPATSDERDWTSLTWLEGIFYWGVSKEEVEYLISWDVTWKTIWEDPLVEECSYGLSLESDPIKRVVVLVFTEGGLSAVQLYMENPNPRAGNREGRHFEGEKLLRYIGVLPNSGKPQPK